MRTKKFNVSLAPFNTLRVFDSEFNTLLRTLKLEGSVEGTPEVKGNVLTVKVLKEGCIFENTYNLPHGALKASTKM